MRIRVLLLVLLLVSISASVSSVAANAQRCNQSCTAAMGPPDSVAGSAITVSTSGRYFNSDNIPATIPFLGQSFEYLCHICQPTTSDECTLENFPTLFSTIKPSSPKINTIIRLETIFNSSPGISHCGASAVYTHEEPFKHQGQRWNLTAMDGTYFNDLEAVVAAAGHSTLC
jgi:hypothetical protein